MAKKFLDDGLDRHDRRVFTHMIVKAFHKWAEYNEGKAELSQISVLIEADRAEARGEGYQHDMNQLRLLARFMEPGKRWCFYHHNTVPDDATHCPDGDDTLSNHCIIDKKSRPTPIKW